MTAPRVIYDRDGSAPYLSRWYPLGRRDDGDTGEAASELHDMKSPEGTKRAPASRNFNVFIHRFHRGDDAGELHSHPFEWSVAFVLVGGYTEERRVLRASGSWVVKKRLIRPFTFNVIMGDDYHRVDLLEEDAWSIFVAGPKLPTWFFWDRRSNLQCQWENYINWRRGRLLNPYWHRGLSKAPERLRNVLLDAAIKSVAGRVLRRL